MIHLGKAGICLERREAFMNGRAVPLSCRAFDVLELLLAAPNQLVTKREFIDAVWPNSYVEENNIAVQIHALRKHLEIDRQTLETVPRRGYRLNIHAAARGNQARAAAGLRASAGVPSTIAAAPASISRP